MPFLFFKRRHSKKLLQQNSKEVLRRLNKYLEEGAEGPIEFLVGFWKNQSDAFTYAEIRQAILDGYITEDTLQLWVQDYTAMITENMYPLWQSALIAGSRGQPIMDKLTEFAFDVNAPSITSWIKDRGADFVTVVTQGQKDAIKVLLSEYKKGIYTVDELARVIRPCIGLDKQQAKANLRYYNSIKSSLKENHPKMKAASVRKKAHEAALKYAAQQHRQRAFTIAQTEIAFAYNKGTDSGVRQAQEQNLLGVMEKRWSTSGDDNVCDICAALDGVQITMDDEFNYKGKVLYAGQKRTPPAHPRCACAVQYIEVSPPVF